MLAAMFGAMRAGLVAVPISFKLPRETIEYIVRDAGLQAGACDRVRVAVEELGFKTGLMESPILGAEGNREFLLHARH